MATSQQKIIRQIRATKSKIAKKRYNNLDSRLGFKCPILNICANLGFFAIFFATKSKQIAKKYLFFVICSEKEHKYRPIFVLDFCAQKRNHKYFYE